MTTALAIEDGTVALDYHVHVGRLLGGPQVRDLRSIADYRAWQGTVFAALRRTPGPLVLCADYRRFHLMNPDVAPGLGGRPPGSQPPY